MTDMENGVEIFFFRYEKQGGHSESVVKIYYKC